jgi:adenosylcobyric acid synthase
MIKGIILNNIRGDISRMVPGAKELEKILNIPVIGMIPHIRLELPLEDSETLRGMKSKGNGSIVISVIKLPRIACFTDLDPLYMEDTTVRFVTEPEELEGTGAVIIPGTKNTIEDLIWMREKGFDKALADLKGKAPILGICGGYQMMGRSLEDPNGIESTFAGTVDGLGFFDNVTRWKDHKKKTCLVEGTFLPTGEPVTGYEVHMGVSEINEKPLFNIRNFSGDEKEGSCKEEEMLFGTYIHGVLEKTSFRRTFLSCVKGGKEALSKYEPKDYDVLIEENLDRLADAFESNMDIEKLMEILGERQ